MGSSLAWMPLTEGDGHPVCPAGCPSNPCCCLLLSSQEDELEVWSYRVAISVVAASFGAGTLGALASPDAGWAAPLREGGNLLAAAGGGGMAVAVALIHIYVAPLKRLLQVLLAAGAAGAAYLAATHPGVPLPAYVADNPGAVWLVGPAFAALTGITFKEGFC